MRRTLGRFRLLLPPPAFVVLYGCIYLLASLPAVAHARQVIAVAVPRDLLEAIVVVHLIGMVIYGFYRAAGFHPIFRPEYRRWLEGTPWAWGKPLPVGPAHPVIEDALIVAAAGLPAWLMCDLHPIASYAAALGAYLFALSLTFARTGAWGVQYVVLFGLGLALRLVREGPETYGAAVLASYLAAMLGLRLSLRSWPWPDVPSYSYDASKGVVVAGTQPERLGWPYDHLGPRPEPPRDRRSTPGAILGSLVAGWWCYAIEHALGPIGPLFLRITVLVNGAFLLALGHVATRVAGHAPPISLIGRIVQFRPIIPSYDQVFVVPVAAVFVAIVGPAALERAGVPPDVAVAACSSVVLMTIFLGGPDRLAWRLTARCRVVPGISSNNNKTGEFVQTG